MTTNQMNDNNIKAGGDINAGDGGYNLSTQERYEEFAKQRRKVMNEPVTKEREQLAAVQSAERGEPVGEVLVKIARFLGVVRVYAQDIQPKHELETDKPLHWKARELQDEVIRLIDTTPPSQPVAHSVISGALFDFMGWLTSREQRLTLSSTDDASPAVEAITDFAKMRGLSLEDARVQDWPDNTTPPIVATPLAAQQKPWVDLTDEEIMAAPENLIACIAYVRNKLKAKNERKEKNT